LLSTRAQLIRRKLRGTPDLITIRTEVDGLVSDASQLSAILEDLLLIADQHDETPVTVDLVELIHQVASAAAPHARAQAVEVTAAQGPPAPILGSPVALRRALTALIDNAIQHARTSVWLSATVADGHVIVEVRDDGPGIDTAIAPGCSTDSPPRAVPTPPSAGTTVSASPWLATSPRDTTELSLPSAKPARTPPSDSPCPPHRPAQSNTNLAYQLEPTHSALLPVQCRPSTPERSAPSARRAGAGAAPSDFTIPTRDL
ncbi:MAG: hypothetical protein QOD96_4951, partial [Pseudonocardiales bacterium]|nr:hypothetical protein [Pseudonocardiales bacterium]